MERQVQSKMERKAKCEVEREAEPKVEGNAMCEVEREVENVIELLLKVLMVCLAGKRVQIRFPKNMERRPHYLTRCELVSQTYYHAKAVGGADWFCPKPFSNHFF